MQNHFAETPEELRSQLRASFDCSMNPYWGIVAAHIGLEGSPEADTARKFLEAADSMMNFAFDCIQDAVSGQEEHDIAGISEDFHQNVAEEGQFAAVPYDPS